MRRFSSHLFARLVVPLAIGTLSMGSAAAQSAKSETAPVASKSSAAASYNTQGFSNQRLARISASMKEQIDAGTFPGAVTVVARNGKVVHFETHGFIDAAKTRAMPGNALRRCSICAAQQSSALPKNACPRCLPMPTSTP